MKNARMNISHFYFILFNLKIFGEIVTTGQNSPKPNPNPNPNSNCLTLIPTLTQTEENTILPLEAK